MPEKIEPWKHVQKSAETKAKIAASMRGNQNRKGKRKPPEERFEKVFIYFAPAVLAALDSHLAKHGGKRSRFVSAAVAAALEIDEAGKPARSFPAPDSPAASA